jgi:predicted secreted protein
VISAVLQEESRWVVEFARETAAAGLVPGEAQTDLEAEFERLAELTSELGSLRAGRLAVGESGPSAVRGDMQIELIEAERNHCRAVIASLLTEQRDAALFEAPPDLASRR